MRIVAFLNPYLRKWLGVSLTGYLTRGHSRRQPKWSGARILTQFPKKCSHHILMQIISKDFQDLQDPFDLREGVKKTFFLGLCPKHRTPPTHRARLGLH